MEKTSVEYEVPIWTQNYKKIIDPWKFCEDVLAANPPWVIVDTETYYNPLNAKAIIRFIDGQPNNEPFMFTFRVPGMGCFSLDHNLMALEELFVKFKGFWVNHNMKYDLHMIANLGLTIPKKIHDTMVMIQLLVPEHWCKTKAPTKPDGSPIIGKDGQPEKGKAKKSKALKNLAYHYLEAQGRFRHHTDPGFPQREGTQWLEDAVDRLRAKLGRTTGRGKKRISYKDVFEADPELMRLYATVDVDLVGEMWEWFYNEIVRDDQLVPYEQDIAATIWLLNMERRGIRMDTLTMQRDELLLTEVIEDAEAELKKFGAFNINSGRDLVAKYTSLYGIKWEWKTEGGETDTTKARLEYVKEHFPETERFTDLVLRYRIATHIRDTYIRGVYTFIQNGRIHADLLLAPMDDSTGATVTGRLSSRNVNLQNIPKRPVKIPGTELVISPREYYIPDEGCVFVRMDYD